MIQHKHIVILTTFCAFLYCTLFLEILPVNMTLHDIKTTIIAILAYSSIVTIGCFYLYLQTNMWLGIFDKIGTGSSFDLFEILFLISN